MTERRVQGGLLLLSSAVLSLFLMSHSIIVAVDYDACFGNYGAAINGERPYVRVAEMSFGALAYAASRQFSGDDLIMAALGLLPLFPFVIAWLLSKTRQTRRFWFVSALVALGVVVTGVSMTSLTDFYDCDRNGLSLGILFAPVFYMVVNMAAMGVLAILRYPFTL